MHLRKSKLLFGKETCCGLDFFDASCIIALHFEIAGQYSNWGKGVLIWYNV